MSILVFIFGFTFGILVSSLVPTSPLLAAFFFIISAGILSAEKIVHRKISKNIWLLSLAILSFSFGVMRFDIKDFHEAGVLERQVGQKINVTGIVVSEPEKRETDTRFVLKTDDEKVLVSTDMYSPILYGDEASVSGKLKKPDVITDDLGRQFDYSKYLAKDDIYYTMSFAKADLIARGKGNPIRSFLIKIKTAFDKRTKAILSEPESSLLSGLLIAGKQALPKTVLEDFRRAGVVHIVVLSGFNITVVAEFFFLIFGTIFLFFRSRKTYLPGVASVLGIILFVAMAGASASIVRAAIMALVAVGGKLTHRQYHAGRALVFAAFLMFMQNPKVLIFDPSFQLSFMATLGMIYLTPLVERYLQKVPVKFGLREMISVTLATQFAVLPFIIYSMGNISLVSLLANILILPIVPFTMLVGFISTLVAFVAPVVAIPFTIVSHVLLSWMLSVAHFLGNLKFSYVQIPDFSVWLMLLSYAAIIVLFLRLRNSPVRSAN